MTFVPAHTIIQGTGSSPTRTAFVLHGILGHQRNWRSYAKSLACAHPHWRFVLVDLRNHGASQIDEGPHTVQQTALDLVALTRQIGSPEAVVGHSFGGKVALVLSSLLHLEQTWVLDAIPDVQGHEARRELRTIFSHLRDVGAPFNTREEMVERLRSRGLPIGLIQWMTTNLRRTDNGYRWAFQLDHATLMIEDYFEYDAFPILRGTQRPIHLIRAANNPRWSEALIQRIEHLDSPVQLHTLEHAGHWVHVDNPKGLRTLMAPYFSA